MMKNSNKIKVVFLLLFIFVITLFISFTYKNTTKIPIKKGIDLQKKIDIGMNLSSVTYWTRELPFVDVFKYSMPWITQDAKGQSPWDTKCIEKIPVDESGYPRKLPAKVRKRQSRQIVVTLMCRSLDGHYPPGIYTCFYEGDGDLEFGLDAKIFKRQKGKILILVSPSNDGILMKLIRSNPKDHVRNIRIIMPNHEKNYKEKPFNPDFLDRLKPFKIIRFMDWQQTNNSMVLRWNQRTKINSYTQHNKNGVALEYMIELCNILKADPWFCIPHMADDIYIRKFAEQIKENLNKDLKIYLEFSNEVWNGQFKQYSWVENNGKNGLSPQEKYADYAKNIFNIFNRVFSDQQNRLIRVVSGQQVNPSIIKNIVKSIGSKNIDAISSAGYFGLKDDDYKIMNQLGKKATANDVIMLANNRLDEAILKMKEHAKFAQENNLEYYIYEGGQHLIPKPNGTEASYIKALWDAQTSDKMYDAYMKLLTSFNNVGGKSFIAFAFVSPQRSVWGSWGHLDFLNQFIFDAPKYLALVDYLADEKTHVPFGP